MRNLLIMFHMSSLRTLAREWRLIAIIRRTHQVPVLSVIPTLLGFSNIQTGRWQTELRERLLIKRWQRCRQTGQIVTIIDDEYPALLRESYRPPVVLFYRGSLVRLHRPLLAVVGARRCTNYTREVLGELLPPLIHRQVGIVSGLAKGADRIAHEVTCRFRGVPIGVIGTGLDKAYPRENAGLQESVARSGVLLSEYPPGTGPRRHHFPERNRIIAALSSATLVTEAQLRSGSLITANLALQANRNVLAVPGPITAPTSMGTNELIQAGATPALNSVNIMEEFGLT
ncbi:DNA-processing protein DprA [Ligilactobacillus sp. LYQ60]|uniref:DNA-processing protein DprA n=1 Tax=unclassified Ligilactobacillus TaxID=2767920 RepID=UPI0038539D07